MIISIVTIIAVTSQEYTHKEGSAEISGTVVHDLPKPGAGDMMFTAFYSWAIWAVMPVCCITGFRRSFEGKDGEEIISRTRPK